MHAGIKTVTAQLEVMRQNELDAPARFMQELVANMKIETDQDMVMAMIFAAGVCGAMGSAPNVLIYSTPPDGGWYIGEGEDPEWGIGLRFEARFGQRFLGCSLRRAVPDEPLNITVETLKFGEPSIGHLRIEPDPAGYRLTYPANPNADTFKNELVTVNLQHCCWEFDRRVAGLVGRYEKLLDL